MGKARNLDTDNTETQLLLQLTSVENSIECNNVDSTTLSENGN